VVNTDFLAKRRASRKTVLSDGLRFSIFKVGATTSPCVPKERAGGLHLGANHYSGDALPMTHPETWNATHSDVPHYYTFTAIRMAVDVKAPGQGSKRLLPDAKFFSNGLGVITNFVVEVADAQNWLYLVRILINHHRFQALPEAPGTRRNISKGASGYWCRPIEQILCRTSLAPSDTLLGATPLLTCAPTATRTRDLLLRRHFRSVAG